MTTPAWAPSYTRAEVTEEFEQICQRLIADGKPFGYDIETSYEGEPREEAQLHPEDPAFFITGLSLTNDANWAKYAPLAHDDFAGNLDNPRCAAAMWALLQTGFGVAHGHKFELRCMSRWFLKYLSDHPLFGEQVRKTKGYYPIRSCTLLESYAEGDNRTHGLKDITWANFRHKMMEITELFASVWGRKMTKKEEKSMRFSSLSPLDQRVIDYACEDALWALAHHYRRYDKLKGYFIYQLEMAVLPIVCEMEDEGVYYDWNFMREGAERGKSFRDRLSTEVSNDLTVLVQTKDPTEPPVRINLGSWKQKSDILYGKLGMSTRRRSKSGNMSTDKIALKGLSREYPVVQKMLNWTSLTKLLGTYLEVYETRYSYAEDGRTHPGHLQHGVPAGRFAVAGPPYQQSPKKYHFELADGTTFDFNFREAIRAPAGWYMLGFDYAQQELRVLAGEAGETALIEAFARGEDVHVKTAAMMLGKPMDEVTDADRQVGKTMNFALGYQMGVEGLADRLGITKDEAQRLFDLYFSIYPRIKAYMEQVIAGAKARGYIVTRFGRKVRIWEFESSERYIYAEGERLAGNAPIQGAGTGDYPKIAMVRARQALAAAGLSDAVRLCMNMHDALEFYVRDDIPPALVIRVLQDAVVFPVEGWPPIVAEWHIGRSWGGVQAVDLLADGSLQLRKKEEPVVLAEADGDPDEEDTSWAVPVSPHLATVAGGSRTNVATVAAAPVPDWTATRTQGAETVFITLDHMPTADQWSRFSQACGKGTGSNECLIKTPQGELLVCDSAASTRWAADISACLGGAMVSSLHGAPVSQT